MNLLSFIFFLILVAGCGAADGKKKMKKPPFVFKERMIVGPDTGMVRLSGNVDAVLAQHWFLDDVTEVSSDSLVWVNGSGERLFPSLNMFSDGAVTENPRGDIKTGRWQRSLKDKINTLQIVHNDGTRQQYRIRTLSLQKLIISWRNGQDSNWISFRSDGIAHQDQRNDPFHPANNNWRFKPPAPEHDSMLNKRVKDCVHFYALYFRDNIKRNNNLIEFGGLPEIFIWYTGGIGLPDKKDIAESWINCFYNKEDALKGYDILKKLLVDNEFEWPRGTPSWNFRTLAVLEQMYAKL